MDGKLHIYHGNGKGKTTAATGLSVRAAASGYRVIFAQFLKSGNSSELKILKDIEGLTILRADKPLKFTSQMTDDEKKALTKDNNRLVKEAFSLAEEKKTLIILDEILDALNKKLIDEEIVFKLLQDHRHMEIVMTGRNPSQTLVDMADYISEINKIKHPYDSGIKARKGIEF